MQKQVRTITPTVAVITRTKDRPLLLKRALESISKQSFDDYELIIVNDGGDQSSVNNLTKQYNSTIKNIRVIHNNHSLGRAEALNVALNNSGSVYIAIHDDDDEWNPEFLRLTTDYLKNTRSKGVVVTTDRIIEKIANGKISIISTERWHPELHEISLYKMCLDNYATPINFMYERSILKTIGYYDKSLDTGEDWEFALRFLLYYDIDFLNTTYALAYYHHRPSSKDDNANSVFLQNHEKNLVKLRNSLLRQDLQEGRFGLGYLVNSIKYFHDETRTQKQYSEYIIEKNLDSYTKKLGYHIDNVTQNLLGEMTNIANKNLENTKLLLNSATLLRRLAKKIYNLKSSKKHG